MRFAIATRFDTADDTLAGRMPRSEALAFDRCNRFPEEAPSTFVSSANAKYPTIFLLYAGKRQGSFQNLISLAASLDFID